MTHVITFLQWVFALGTPAIVGIVALRRIVREHDWCVVIGGGLVLGQAALMVLVNELRFAWEMNVAAWTAYKLLAFGTLLLVASTAPLRAAVAGRRSAWPGLALPLAGAAFCAVYFGIPAFRGLLHDAWWFHYPTAIRAQTLAQFPLTAPFAPDDLLYYHYGPDLLAAVLGHALHLPVAHAFALLISTQVAAGFLLACGLVRRVSRSLPAGLVAAALLYLGGNLRFLLLPAADWSSPLGVLQVFNSQTVDGLLKLTFTPSHAVGIPLVLLILALYRRWRLSPTWPSSILLGLMLGAISLIAEWYFLPLGLALAWHGAVLWRKAGRDRRAAWRLGAALALAGGCCLFNGSYLAGLFTHYWMPRSAFGTLSTTRQWLQTPAPSRPANRSGPTVERPAITQVTIPKLAPPPLVPLHLNLRRLGMVPSWADAQSTGGSVMPLWSPRFILEAFPILAAGVAFAVWTLRRRAPSVAGVLALMVLVSCLPPLFLDWGYRSTDFLRFFTAAVALSAVLIGCLLPAWWRKSHRVGRIAIGLGLGTAAINCVGLGVIGLMPSAFAQAKSINDQGGALRDAVKSAPAATAQRESAMAVLAQKARFAIRPISGGRENLVVIAPENRLPPSEKFPEWLKLSTLVEAPIPIGWFWSESLYTHYYREAATTLAPSAIAALDARWVIVTDLFGAPPPPAVTAALDSGAFISVARFEHGGYHLKLYRVRATAR